MAWLADPSDLTAGCRMSGPVDVCLTELVAGTTTTAWFEEVRATAPGARVVVLTSRLRRSGLAALCASTDAVVPKSAPVDLALQAVEGRRSGLVHHPAPAATQETAPTLLEPALTPREHEVLTELANGLSTDRIADQLGVAHTTARTYIQSILTKLGVHSKVQAVALAFSLDLVGPPDLAASPMGGAHAAPSGARVA